MADDDVVINCLCGAPWRDGTATSSVLYLEPFRMAGKFDALDDPQRVRIDNRGIGVPTCPRRGLTSLATSELARLHRKLQREFDAVQAIDFFPGEASVEAEAAWADFNKRIESVLSLDEPHEIKGRIPPLDAGKYQGRTWATRRRLWVDRVASAWLIRRFIDRDARFRWLAAPSDCPKRALGFDFDGAAFTHVGNRVTFETLLASFGLEEDLALMRLATIVHALDAGGEPVPEAKGFEAVMAGARERLTDDDALLGEMSTVLDSLYAHFEREAGRGKDKGNGKGTAR